MKYLRLVIILLILDSILTVLNCYFSGAYIYYNAAVYWCLAIVINIVGGVICLYPNKNWKMALIWFANILISGLILLIGCEVFPHDYDEDSAAVEIIRQELEETKVSNSQQSNDTISTTQIPN